MSESDAFRMDVTERVDALCARLDEQRAAAKQARADFDRADKVSSRLHAALCAISALAPECRNIDTAERIAKAALEKEREIFAAFAAGAKTA